MKLILTGLFIINLYSGSAQIVSGIVIDTVLCSATTSQSYALYLPSSYSENEKWPIIYFFEPAARGRLPVDKYKEVADEFGYILVASNNSRNGSWEAGFEAGDAMLADTQSKFSINKDRMYTSGFSGGSRFALSAAVLSKAFDGVIGVGASQPPVINYQVQERQKFLYVGLVGNKDMNYVEHKLFADKMDELGMANLLIISTLNHQWASMEDFRLGLLWIQAQRNELQSTVKLSTSLDAKIEMSKDSVGLLDQFRLRQGFNALITLNEELDEKTLKKLRNEDDRSIQEEISVRKQLSDSITIAFQMSANSSSATKWIVHRIEYYNKKIEGGQVTDRTLMYQRLVDFVRAIGVENAMNLVAKNEFEKALVGIEISASAIENERYAHWWYAKIYALMGDEKKSIEHFGKLVKEGFDRPELVENESAFSTLLTDSEFARLLNSIRN